MTQLTPEQWLSKNSSKVEKTTARVTSKKVQSPEEWLKDPQINPEKQSTLGKVGSLAKAAAKEIVSPFERIGATLLPGEQTGIFVNQIQPIRNIKDVGAVGLQVAGFAPIGRGLVMGSKLGKLAIEGAAGNVLFGAGKGIEENKSAGEIARQVPTDAAIGAIGGPALSIAGRAIGKVFGKKAPEVVPNETIVPETIQVDVPLTPVEFVAQAKAKKEGTLVPPTELSAQDDKLVKDTPSIPKGMSKGRVNSADLADNTVPPGVDTGIPKEVKPIFSQEQRQKYEKVLEEDPTFVKGETSNKDIIDTYARVKAEMGDADFVDAIYGVNGKRLPQDLPASSAYNLIQTENLTEEQSYRLMNKQPLSKAGFDLQAAKIANGDIVTNPLELAQLIEVRMAQEVGKKGITNKSIKGFLDGIECK